MLRKIGTRMKQALDAGEDAPADDVGGDGAHEEDEDDRGEEAQSPECAGRRLRW